MKNPNNPFPLDYHMRFTNRTKNFFIRDLFNIDNNYDKTTITTTVTAVTYNLLKLVS